MKMSSGYRAKIGLTDEEERVIKEYVFLPLIKMAFERDKKVINITNTKFKQRYLDMIDAAIHKVSIDMKNNKEDIFKYHIQMNKKSWLEFNAYVKGYSYDIVYHKSIAGDWINERIKNYL
jgi:hypothetical protein